MTLSGRIFLWAPFRRLFGLSSDRLISTPAQPRSLRFQLVESEVSVADALLDLDDVKGCELHMLTATQQVEELRGPEYIVMHQRLRTLRQKRSDYKETHETKRHRR